MKKVLMFFLASVLLSGAAAAQYDMGYMAFFTDASRTTNCVAESSIPPPPGNIVQCYIFCLPSVRGQMGAEFQVNLPANTALITTLDSPNVALSMGDLQTGISLAVGVCQTDWNWIMQVIMYVNDNSQTALSFAPHSGTGFLVFPNCEINFPTEDIRVLNQLLLNIDPGDPACVFGTSEASWGAIKSMYKE